MRPGQNSDSGASCATVPSCKLLLSISMKVGNGSFEKKKDILVIADLLAYVLQALMGLGARGDRRWGYGGASITILTFYSQINLR